MVNNNSFSCFVETNSYLWCIQKLIMTDLFNFQTEGFIKKTDKLEPKGKSISKEEKSELKKTTRDDNAMNILKDVGGFPTTKNYLAIKTNGTSDAGSFFNCALKVFGEVEEMYLATWTISKSNVNRLRDEVGSGKLKKLVMVISSTLKPANPALYAYLIGKLNEFENVEIKEVNSHAKTFSMKCGDNFFTISGSANWSENPRIENFLILNDRDLYEHHAEWMDEL